MTKKCVKILTTSIRALKIFSIFYFFALMALPLILFLLWLAQVELRIDHSAFLLQIFCEHLDKCFFLHFSLAVLLITLSAYLEKEIETKKLKHSV